MVAWALDGLKATRPDVAVEFEAAVEKGKRLRVKAGRPKKGTENAGNARINYQTAEHIRARLERDGYAASGGDHGAKSSAVTSPDGFAPQLRRWHSSAFTPRHGTPHQGHEYLRQGLPPRWFLRRRDRIDIAVLKISRSLTSLPLSRIRYKF